MHARARPLKIRCLWFSFTIAASALLGRASSLGSGRRSHAFCCGLAMGRWTLPTHRMQQETETHVECWACICRYQLLSSGDATEKRARRSYVQRTHTHTHTSKTLYFPRFSASSNWLSFMTCLRLVPPRRAKWRMPLFGGALKYPSVYYMPKCTLNILGMFSTCQNWISFCARGSCCYSSSPSPSSSFWTWREL